MMNMKKNVWIALAALFVAVLGLIIGLAAYFRNRSSYLFDDEDDFLFDDPEDFEYYTSDLEDIPEEAPEEAPESEEEGLSF